MAHEKAFFQRRPVILATALLCCLIWGVSYPLLKTGYRLLDITPDDIISKFLFAGIRFTVAGTMTLLYAGIRRGRRALPGRRQMGGIALLSLFQTILQYLFIYIGLSHTQSSKGSILNQLGVFLLVLLTPLVYREERLSAKKLLGCVLGFAGIVIINLTGQWSWSFTLSGEGFVILSSLSAATGYLISKRVSQGGDPVVITGCQQLLGGLILLLPGILGGGSLSVDTPAAAGVLAFLSGSVAVVYILWMMLLKYNDVSEIAIYKFGVPVIGTLSSGLLLGEDILSLHSPLALMMVSAGIVMVNLRRRKPRTASLKSTGTGF